MFRRSASVLILILSTTAAGNLCAQQPAISLPADTSLVLTIAQGLFQAIGEDFARESLEHAPAEWTIVVADSGSSPLWTDLQRGLRRLLRRGSFESPNHNRRSLELGHVAIHGDTAVASATVTNDDFVHPGCWVGSDATYQIRAFRDGKSWSHPLGTVLMYGDPGLCVPNP